MPAFFTDRRSADPAQRPAYARYLAQRMGPMIYAMLLMAALSYLIATCARALIATSPVPLHWRLLPVLPLAIVAWLARRERRPQRLSLLTLSCLLFLELGINLNGSSPLPGQPWVIPGLLLPVVSSVIWLGRKDFIAAMALCAAGPLPLLMLGAIDGRHIYQYVVYMAIAIALSCVLRSFMARTLFAQYRLEQRLREQAYTDGLTGLLQRNRFLELAQHALDDCRQRQRPASVLYLDTDHFKQLNDDYGHATGDAALIGLASVLRTHARGTDLIGRIGGEEFAVLLPGLDLTRTCVRAELLREAVRQIQRPDGPLTISTGVTESRYPGETIETMLARADQAMRQAKRDGRDRIVSDGQAIAS